MKLIIIIFFPLILILNNLFGIKQSKSNIQLQKIEHKDISPISYKMYEKIEFWSDSFKIPKYIAYNIAFLETGYKGPFHTNYNPYQTSSANAVGPMQIIPKYAKSYINENHNLDSLKYDIDMNVMVSMKMLKVWYNRYRDWAITCGAYNSGQPILNNYAIYASSNKNYKQKWVKINN